MIDEAPVNTELLRQMLCQRFQPKGLGGVVAALEDVDA